MALNIGAMSAVAAYIVHSIFDFNLHIPANTLVMAFVFAVLVNPGIELPYEPKTFGPLPRMFQLALPALALWLLVASALKFPGEFFAERARVALRDEKYAESVAFAGKAIAWEKKNPYLYFYLGEAQSMLAEAGGNRAPGGALLTAAGESFQKGLELFPQDRYLLLGMGWILDTLARFSAAEAFYLKALEWEPNSAHVRMLYAGHLQRAGRYADAAAQYRKSLDLQWTVTANAGLQRLVKDGKVRK
jgi:tetratricopeptide (TPR) repeat protein